MIIISNKFGQLGNRLILFAHFIAFATEYRLSIANLAFDEYAPLFSSTAADLFCRFPPSPSRLGTHPAFRSGAFKLIRYAVRLIRKLKIENSILRLVSIPTDVRFIIDESANLKLLFESRLTFVEGWQYRAPHALQKHGDIVRTYFKPLECYQSAVDSLIMSIRTQCDVLIGVHIRQGDYNSFAEGKYFYGVEIYLGFMEQMQSLFPSQRVAFLICSNEKQDVGRFSEFRLCFGNDHLLEDMYAFAKCDFLIGPPSTYTLWASFYGRVPLLMIYDKDAILQIDQFKIYDVLP